MVAPLRAVGLEKFGTRNAPQKMVQTPRQTRRVADASAHALPSEWRHEVGRVPGDQDSVVGPSRCVLGVESPNSVALERRAIWIHSPGGEELPRFLIGVKGVEVLPRESHELPAAP